MTEASYPPTTAHAHGYAQPQLTNGAGVGGGSHRHAAPMTGVAPEDDEIICICENLDDDGLTVACDLCNKWQHQLCYYPEFEDQSLPDDLQHFCVRCKPRSLDVAGANARQTVRKEEQASLVNGVKRPSSKSHKKKVKETPYTNGWPMDKSRHDRNSASPRDQPPPAKRAKTNHRSSESVATLKGHSRKRNMSNAVPRRSPSQSPDSPLELYSREFMRTFGADQWEVTHANLHNSITVTNALSDWLNINDDEFRTLHHCEKAEVLMRWDGDLDDIPGKAQTTLETVHDERVRDSNGNFPTWKTVTVEEPIAGGAYIGELKGHVGFQDDYFSDESNRWDILRHPEPFVFFHSKLPIYVDARHEGTDLRFIRRSCSPNAQLKILVTDQTDYRFCFMATQQIDPGMEIAVPWDTVSGLSQQMNDVKNGTLSTKYLDRMCSWVSMVMANCGPCACSKDEGCLMQRFDRRNPSLGLSSSADDPPPAKMPKPSKRKRAAPHISPLNTHVNSRSGSEARKVEPDDDPSDSRSTSGRGSASRDNTPNTHYSATVLNVSERERKKLAKEEEMFRRQEEEKSGKQGKKKRTSGGSTLNTPSDPKPKQQAFGPSRGYADAGTSKQAGLPSKPGRKPKNPPKPPPKTITKIVKRPKPDYTDSSTQCDLDQEEANARPKPKRRQYMSLTTLLLQRCALNNTRRPSGQSSSTSDTDRSSSQDAMDVDQPPVQSPVLTHKSNESTKSIANSNDKDAEMQDVDDDDTASQTQEQSNHSVSGALAAIAQPSLPINPPAPPWPSQPSHTTRPPESESAEHNAQSHHKNLDMHIAMPPPSSNPFASSPGPSSLSSQTPNANPLLSAPIATTPASFLPPSLPAQVSVSSPQKKKMSLSDYSQRRKAKDKENVEARTDRESSPASVASGPVVPPLLSQGSEAAAAGEQAIVEDVGMEDVVAMATS